MLPNHLSDRNDVPTESVDDETDGVIDVSQAIERAERILPGQAAAEGESDPRWQAIMLIEDFIEEEPDSIWPFILRWGVNHDEGSCAPLSECCCWRTYSNTTSPDSFRW